MPASSGSSSSRRRVTILLQLLDPGDAGTVILWNWLVCQYSITSNRTWPLILNDHHPYCDFVILFWYNQIVSFLGVWPVVLQSQQCENILSEGKVHSRWRGGEGWSRLWTQPKALSFWQWSRSSFVRKGWCQNVFWTLQMMLTHCFWQPLQMMLTYCYWQLLWICLYWSYTMLILTRFEQLFFSC